MKALLPIFVLLAPQSPTVDKEMQNDVVLRALVDEMGRGQQGLVLPGMLSPYFLELALFDGLAVNVVSELGATSGRGENRYRNFRCHLRVGSYELDNSNFPGARGSGGLPMPIEDDYNAIRQSLWWSMDRTYKGAVEDLARKKAFMETKLIENKPEDFSKEPPAVSLEKLRPLSVDRDRLDKMAASLSKVFKQYPAIQESKVEMWDNPWNLYLVNTEGTRIRHSNRSAGIQIVASTQAEDGMRHSDSFQFRAKDLDGLPSEEELRKKCVALAEGLLAIRVAPRIQESYSGPVWLEASVAASFLSGEFGARFCGGQRPVGTETSTEDFSQKLNKRIFPKSLQVTDDPALDRFEGEAVLSHYKYDDQGVQARAVTLVKEGRLQELLMSRNPSKEFQRSTGHGRGFFSISAKPSCLRFESSEGLAEPELRREFVEAFQDEDLPFGIRIASLDAESWENPLRAYKVFPDGREELVRGFQFGPIDLKAYKRILAFGNRPALIQQSQGGTSTAAIAPALIFEEIDLGKIDKDLPKTPILPNPLTRP